MKDKTKIEERFSFSFGEGFERVVYFIGIGGIGMSAIARFLNAGGMKVSGYDKTPTALTTEMEKSGIAVHYEENVDLIPKKVGLVVYTPAIPEEHKELSY